MMYCSGVCSTYMLYAVPLISLTSTFIHCRSIYVELLQIIITKQGHNNLFVPLHFLYFHNFLFLVYVLHIDFLISVRSFTPVVMIELFSYKKIVHSPLSEV